MSTITVKQRVNIVTITFTQQKIETGLMKYHRRTLVTKKSFFTFKYHIHTVTGSSRVENNFR